MNKETVWFVLILMGLLSWLILPLLVIPLAVACVYYLYREIKPKNPKRKP